MKPKHISCKGNLLNLEKPIVAGILNVTPDSFYDGGKYLNKKNIARRCRQMAEEGADIIDVGAASSRPGAKIPSPEEESRRLLQALETLRHHLPEIPVSADTFRYEIAKQAHDFFHIGIINDISAGEEDPKLPEFAAENNLPYILMHKQGTPETMQNKPEYENVVKELIEYFSRKIKKFRLVGINDLIIDPGFGFGKTLEHNYELLANLEHFQITQVPLMVGLSRKSMIYKRLEIGPEDSLTPTAVLHKTALDKKADILRVHDVKEAKQTIELYWELKKYTKN